MFLRARSSRTKTTRISNRLWARPGIVLRRRVISQANTRRITLATHIITTDLVIGSASGPMCSVGRSTSPTNGRSRCCEFTTWRKMWSPALNAPSAFPAPAPATCPATSAAIVPSCAPRPRVRTFPARHERVPDLQSDGRQMESEQRPRHPQEVDARPQSDIDQSRAVYHETAKDAKHGGGHERLVAAPDRPGSQEDPGDRARRAEAEAENGRGARPAGETVAEEARQGRRGGGEQEHVADVARGHCRFGASGGGGPAMGGPSGGAPPPGGWSTK